MENKLCFAQFIHPGKERRPDRRSLSDWNIISNRHRRKFLKQSGPFLEADRVREDELVFWGEWEAESWLLRRVDDPEPGGPKFVYEPYYMPPRSYVGLQNTDPFVFGPQFLYTGCQQRRDGRATQLRYLAEGAVILFGSLLDLRKFVIDTVFVVRGWIDHDRATYSRVLKGSVPREYSEVTIGPWYHCRDSEDKRGCGPVLSGSWRLYFGATYENPIHGMFSFFPCLPSNMAAGGFPRPTISLPEVITGNFSQGFKLNPTESLDLVKERWDQVVEQVGEQRLKLGLSAAMPMRISQQQ